jgi:uncharacterized membrane protein (DUF4010 family)
MNFAGYIAQRTATEGRGYLLTGLLGGVISSTAVTFGFARYSREHPNASSALAAGVIGACTVLVPRVLIISAVLSPAVATRLAFLIVPAGIIGTLVMIYVWKFADVTAVPIDPSSPINVFGKQDRNPLRFWLALRLAVIFQVALMAVAFVRDLWSVKGLYGTAVLLGLTDVDALTVSMSTPSSDIIPAIAARAIAIGILANTIVKFGLSTAVGSGRYRLFAGAILIAMAAAIAAAIAIF